MDGLTNAVAVYERFDGEDVQQRLATPAIEAGAELFLREAKKPTVGFKNRTHKLRNSLRVITGRGGGGRFISALEVTAQTPYAAFVEHKRRTIDKRRGPPYWFGEVLRRLGAKMGRTIEQEGSRRVDRLARRR